MKSSMSLFNKRPLEVIASFQKSPAADWRYMRVRAMLPQPRALLLRLLSKREWEGSFGGGPRDRQTPAPPLHRSTGRRTLSERPHKATEEATHASSSDFACRLHTLWREGGLPPNARAMRAAVKVVRVAAASSAVSASTVVPKESFRSSDFGCGAKKKGWSRSRSSIAARADRSQRWRRYGRMVGRGA
jgi:hypothetical protein